MIRSLRSPLLFGVLALANAGPVAAQQQPKLPALTTIETILARTSEPMGAVSTTATIAGGHVLVNDILGRRVLMFDSTLTLVRVVADSTPETQNAYGARGGGLLSFGGDSALFVDPASLTMIVINNKGELAGVKAVPRANEIGFLVGGPNGRPGFDASGRMIYRGMARGAPAAANARPTMGNFVMPQQPDSAPVVRVDPSNRKLDTLAMFKIPKLDINISQGADGRMNIQTRLHPMPTTDDWALLSDGTIAIVRGHDFHVDWIDANKQVTSSPKIPFEWVRLSDEDKEYIVDSVRTAMEKQREEAQRLMTNAGGPAAFMSGGGAERMMVMSGIPGGGGGFGGGGGGGGAPPQRAGGGSGDGAPPTRGGQGGPGGAGGFQIPAVNIVPANELPDYRPPFGQQSALGDLDGHLWVRTSAPVGEAGPVYFVIDKKNEVVARVQAPQGRIVVGFGKAGVVYLAFRDAEGRSFMEMARWR